MTEHKDPNPNITAALSYLIFPFTGMLFFVLEKEDKYVRYHAFQSILFGIAVIGASFVISVLNIPIIGFLLRQLLSLGTFGCWLLLMWKAYNNEKYELPYLGKMAKEQIYKK